MNLLSTSFLSCSTCHVCVVLGRHLGFIGVDGQEAGLGIHRVKSCGSRKGRQGVTVSDALLQLRMGIVYWD